RNLYRYLINSPSNRVDPSGLQGDRLGPPFDPNMEYPPEMAFMMQLMMTSEGNAQIAAWAQQRPATAQVPSKKEMLRQQFMRWYSLWKSKGNSWADDLPACPCSINVVVSEHPFVGKKCGILTERSPGNPDPNVWEDPTMLNLLFQQMLPGVPNY